jgi:hypothetical protein
VLGTLIFTDAVQVLGLSLVGQVFNLPCGRITAAGQVANLPHELRTRASINRRRLLGNLERGIAEGQVKGGSWFVGQVFNLPCGRVTTAGQVANLPHELRTRASINRRRLLGNLERGIAEGQVKGVSWFVGQVFNLPCGRITTAGQVANLPHLLRSRVNG